MSLTTKIHSLGALACMIQTSFDQALSSNQAFAYHVTCTSDRVGMILHMHSVHLRQVVYLPSGDENLCGTKHGCKDLSRSREYDNERFAVWSIRLGRGIVDNLRILRVSLSAAKRSLWIHMPHVVSSRRDRRGHRGSHAGHKQALRLTERSVFRQDSRMCNIGCCGAHQKVVSSFVCLIG